MKRALFLLFSEEKRCGDFDVFLKISNFDICVFLPLEGVKIENERQNQITSHGS